MQRIAIVGCPGTGKTTLATQMGKILDVPVIHLDYYYHQLKYSYYTDKQAWIAKVEELIKAEAWIMDGNYNATIPQRFARADTIIFLDFSRSLALYRVIKRRIYYRNKRRPEMPSDWVEQADFNFLKYVWSFKKHNYPQIYAALDADKDKQLVLLKDPTQLQNYIHGLTRRG